MPVVRSVARWPKSRPHERVASEQANGSVRLVGRFLLFVERPLDEVRTGREEERARVGIQSSEKAACALALKRRSGMTRRPDWPLGARRECLPACVRARLSACLAPTLIALDGPKRPTGPWQAREQVRSFAPNCGGVCTSCSRFGPTRSVAVSSWRTAGPGRRELAACRLQLARAKRQDLRQETKSRREMQASRRTRANGGRRRASFKGAISALIIICLQLAAEQTLARPSGVGGE